MLYLAIAAWVVEVIGFLMVYLNDPPDTFERIAGTPLFGLTPGSPKWRRVQRRRRLKFAGFLALLTGFSLQFVYLAVQLGG